MAIPDKAVTRGEQYLAALAGQSGTLPDEPITRKEFYLAKAAGQDVETPPPITREEKYLDVIAEGGGGGEAVLVTKTVTENGTYSAEDDNADGYSSVTVNVPNVPPSNVNALYNNISSGTISFYPFVYNSALNAIVGQSSTQITGGTSASKNTAIQGSHIVIGVNVAITGVTYNGNPLPYSNLGGGTTRFTVIELPDGYDPAVAIGLNRS